MNLMGKYAAANHAMIHRKIAKALGEKPAVTVENHHNFAWKETHDGKEVIVHRKGATPAGRACSGSFPARWRRRVSSSGARGSAESLESASHGAGRLMSRTAAREKFRWNHLQADARRTPA
jgi:tRNA-splicing ligase RtcB